MRILPIAAVAALFALGASAAPSAPSPGKTQSQAEILAAAPARDWRRLDPARLIYLELPKGRVVIELAPEFAPRHVENIRRLVRARYFDRTAIVRAQDNFVVQWGVPDGAPEPPLGQAQARIAEPEFTRPAAGLAFTPLASRDAYAPQVGFAGGFPAARDPKTGQAWLTHCYGTVAAARSNDPAEGAGSSLYAVIGPARRLDRNLTVVGRVVRGMELLAVAPRGPEPMGFYASPSEAVPVRMRLGDELPPAQRIALEALRTDSATFARLVEARRNRRDDFYRAPPGGLDVCDVALPVRPGTAR